MKEQFKQSLIAYLLNHHGYVAGSKLSTILHVSTKTIVRNVKKINAESPGEPIIESKRGRGYRLNYQNYLKVKHDAGTPHNASNLSTVERRNEVIKKLLITSPEKQQVRAVFGKFFVSDSVISSDIKIIRTMLAKYHLTVHRKNEYVWIDGKELDIRNAINSLLVSDDVISISHFLQENQYVRKRDASFVIRQLGFIEEQMDSDIPYPYNVNLFSHLYVLIERYQNVGSLVESDFALTDTEKEAMQSHPQMFKISQQVVSNLSRYLNTELPPIEVYYLYQYLTSSRVNNTAISVNDVSDNVRAVTDFLIDKVTQDPQYRYLNSNELFTNLANHIKPLLNRLENNIKVKNNLLGQISLEYPHLFKVVQEATAELSKRYDLNKIDDEEVGFITVYFAQAAENKRPPINVIAVCTTGFGTAQLLKAKLEKRFSELNIIDVVSSRELADKIDQYPSLDLIVSTIELPKTIKVPTLIVSAILTLEDQERLDQKVDKIRKKMLNS
ncbi:MAG TPA: PRD domain-containing protein [Candidatus Limosilactobacillus merdipullorum]|uniref:PRD domain-containing protein n=1 Tax=Candidatus Limosilactobacillus merdipullorum TaxID=2838653 RepID=A0A9D1QPQ9_9LACO|nr:PRD domain-containing protein [Candidatus Limosilactobacillus merdipullorum]